MEVSSSKVKATDLKRLKKTLGLKAAGSRRLFTKAAIKELPAAAKLKLDKLSFDYSSMISIADDRDLKALQTELLKEDNVVAAYIKPPAEEPVAKNWTTGDLEGSQGYLEKAPNGIDAKYAWRFAGGRGDNISIADVEQGFNFDHEDFPKNFGGFLAGDNIDSSKNHGTAVLGVLAANDDTKGVTGISHNARIYAISHNGLGTSQAIIRAADKMKKGDIILLEVHRRGPAGNKDIRQDGYIAIEWWPDDFAAIVYAVGKGIVVVEAAGNGGEDLDARIYNTPQDGFPSNWKNPFNKKNPQSGAVVVGAGYPTAGKDLTKYGYSNWGSRVDTQGWGGGVATIGYGGLQSDQTLILDPFSGWKATTDSPDRVTDRFQGMGLTNIDAVFYSGKNKKIYFFAKDQYSRVDAGTLREDSGYPKEIKDEWSGLPSGFRKNVDAALWNDKSKKVYFFKGDEFVRLDPFQGWKLDAGYPKKIKGNWPGLPTAFTKKVDTAFWSYKNKKVYMFSDNKYVRIDPFNDWKVDAGYPKPIAGNWADFPKSFQKSVDHAFYHPDKKLVYLSKGEDIVYTGGFSGTSSASPIVTGAIACIQSRLKHLGKPLLTSEGAQKLMRSTGTPQRRLSGDPETDASSNWKGVNVDFGSGIDTAMLNGKSNKIYLFKGDRYLRVDPKQNWNVEKTYPKPIEDGWKGLDDNFKSNLDAALWSGSNKKAYFFKGSEYVRLDPADNFKMEAGYPKSIAAEWAGLPSSFHANLDAAVWNPRINRVYFFKGDKYVRLNPANGWKRDAGYPKLIRGNWKALTGNDFEEDLDAVLYSASNKKVYAFKGENYVRMDPFNGWKSGAGYPKVIARQRIGKRPDLKEAFRKLKIDSNWPGMPASFGRDIDAGFYSRTNKKVYLFNGTKYVRIDPAKAWAVEPGYPKSIATHWKGLPSGFKKNLDAALWNAKSTKLYIFKGNKYVRLNPKDGWKMDAGYPKPIQGNWKGFPANFAEGVNTAFWADKNKKIYFFKDGEYLRVDPANGFKVEPGYPKPIAGNWKGLDSGFDNDLDVALLNVPGKAVYFFKGGEYLKMDATNWKKAAYYPKPIIR